MSLSAWEQQFLDSIKDGLAGSDPQLAALLTTFTELASGEEMPVREKIRASSRRAVWRSRRQRRHYGRDRAGRLYQQLRLRWALLLWLLVTAAMIGVALTLSRGAGGQAPCTGSWSTFCVLPAPAPSSPPAPHGVPVNHVSG